MVPVVRNPPAHAEDPGLIPGPGRSHKLPLQSPHSRARAPNERRHPDEQPTPRSREQALLAATEEPECGSGAPVQPKMHSSINF